MLTIPRSKLIQIADEAIDNYVPNLSAETVARLREVSRTVEQIAASTWKLDEKCGCLVGSLHLDDPDWSYPTPDDGDEAGTLELVGIDFDALLFDEIEEEYEYGDDCKRVKVID